jgi:hypothetical protein
MLELRILALGCLLPVVGPAPGARAGEVSPAPQAFRQEVAARWLGPTGVKLLDLAPAGGVLACDGQGWFATTAAAVEPVPCSLTLGDGKGWIVEAGKPREVPVPTAALRHICRGTDAVWLATTNGVVRLPADGVPGTELAGRDVQQVATGPRGVVLAATDQGLLRRETNATWKRVRVVDQDGRTSTNSLLRGVAIASDGTWWVATPDRVGFRRQNRWRFLDGRDGVPVADFTCAAAGPGGEVWFGTRRGAVRFDGQDWAYREGPRWLPGNDVRSVAVDAQGTAWFATDQGLGSIERREMTLAAKAAHYEEEVQRYLKRTPFGYLSEVGLGAPGDRSQIIYSDSDNDGLWTAMYGAGECFAYAATKDPAAKIRAQQAFEALRFLQRVTQGGPHSPPKGFVARTIRPVEWPDPNAGRLEADRREQQESDRLWKVYEPRWPKSADGKWYWKSDTSSDELDGHFFLYAAYFEHVAETEAEKEAVREVVRDLADHLVRHDFCLVDHDGTPTRWGVFGPKYLNHDPRWWVERGLNSLSILSYLTVAAHVTGEARFEAAARELIERHGYGANVMNPKTQTGVGSGNQSDDEMAFMCFYNLLRYTKDTAWREKWRFGFYAYAALEQPEMNPFFNFAFAAQGLGQSYSNAYGTLPLTPWAGWQDDAMATLRGFPLDRVNWPQHNSHRLDLVPLRPQESQDLADTQRRQRAGRVNGKVLPVAERHFGHWNTDPWRLDYGGDGRELASGTVFLLPYYLGLYHGFIEKPQ